MKQFGILIAFILFGHVVNAQSCPECRYASVVFDSVEVSTVKFGEGINADGDLQELFMDIYTPYGDTVTNRPVSIFAFGGGFVQGSRDEEYVERVCTRFAKAGYVGVGIDYRIGFDPFGLFPIPTEELMRVFFRAMQDMRGAIQWFKAHADQMGNTLNINKDQILIGGGSAGAITACMTAYCDKSSEFAEIGDTNAIAALGGFYSSSGIYDSYPWDVQGVFSIAGGLVNTDWIEVGDPPIFNAHGDQDIVVPYQGGNFGIGPISIGLEGSFNVDAACRAIGVCSYLFTIEGGGHPSGGESEEYYNQILMRALPRSKAGIENKSFCCPFEAEITPGDTILATPSQTLTLTAQGSGTTAPQYKWCEAVCGSTANTQAIEFIPVEFPGYMMLLVEENGCIATDFVQLDALPVGQVETLTPGLLSIFPNPSSGEVNLLSTRQDLAIESASLFDLSGKSLLHWDLAAESSAQIDLGNLTSGLYFLMVSTNRGIAIEKMVVR